MGQFTGFAAPSFSHSNLCGGQYDLIFLLNCIISAPAVKALLLGWKDSRAFLLGR